MIEKENLPPNATESKSDAASVTLQVAENIVEAFNLARDSDDFKLAEYLANSIPTPGGIATLLESLSTRRENWEKTELAASHARLYAILTNCYEFYLTMKSETTPKGVRKQLVAGLDLFLDAQGLRTLSNTHDMNKVVKAVFGDERRRVSAYAMVLRAALISGPDMKAQTAHVPASDLAAWIETKGGVEEIRLGSKKGGMSETQRAEIARTDVEAREPLLTIKPNAKAMPFGADDADKMLVLLVMYRPTGDLEVNAVVKSDSVVRAALAAHYAANKEALTDAKQAKDAARTSATGAALSN